MTTMILGMMLLSGGLATLAAGMRGSMLAVRDHDKTHRHVTASILTEATGLLTIVGGAAMMLR